MKILMTSETYLPRIGGAEVHVQSIVRMLLKKGHEVVLITNEEGLKDSEVAGLKIIRIPWRTKNAFLIFKILLREVKKCDVVHSHYCHRLAMIAGFAALLHKKRQVITLHGMGILDPATRSYRAKKLHAFYRKSSLLLASHIISTSQDLAEVAYRFIKRNKVTVIYNGYDPELFTPRNEIKSTDKKIILTVRRLVPKNGIQYLIESMPGILAKIPNVELRILGDGPLLNTLKERVVSLDIAEHVKFEGFKQNSYLVSELHNADVVVFPSTAESVSLACVEAMAMKKTVVASRVGGLIELIGDKEDRGIFVDLVDWQESNYDAPIELPPSKISALTDGVVKALIDSPDNQSKKDAAYEYVKKNLSWETIVTATVGVYLAESR